MTIALVPPKVKPTGPARTPHPAHKPDLVAMRRQLIETAWLDYKLFGYMTETSLSFARRIQREKAA